MNTQKKKHSNARKSSTVPTQNWEFAIVEPRANSTSNRPESQAHDSEAYVLVNDVCWRRAPPTAKVAEVRRSLQGNLLFPSLAAALKSGLGDQKQLKAVAKRQAYTGVTIPSVGVSTEDMDYLEQELDGKREFDNCYRRNEKTRRHRMILAVVRTARKTGDLRPREIVREQRTLHRALDKLHERRREVRQSTRSRIEPTEINEQIDQHRAELRKLRQEFKAYYPKPKKSPTARLDRKIKALQRATTMRATRENMSREGYQPSLRTVRCQIEKAIQQRIQKFDFQDGLGEVPVTREILQARLARVEAKETANLAKLEKLVAQRAELNRPAAIQEQHCKRNKAIYKEWAPRLSSGTRAAVRAKYGNKSDNPKLSKGAPPRVRITDKRFARRGERYQLVEAGEGSIDVQVKDVTKKELLSGMNSSVGLTIDEANPTHGILRLKTTFRTLHLPIKYHRDLPADAVIKNVKVKREKDASKMRSLFHRNDGFRLKLFLTIESQTFVTPTRLPGATCSIAPAFKVLDGDDVRLGVFSDTNGYRAEMIIPNDTRSMYLVPMPGPDGKVKRLGIPWEKKHEGRRPGKSASRIVQWKTGRSKHKMARKGIIASLKYADGHHRKEKNERREDGRDHNLVRMRDSLVEWIAANPTLVPEWLQERCKYLYKLKSPGGLSAISYLFMNHIQEAADPYPEVPLRGIQIKRRLSRAQIKAKSRRSNFDILEDLWHWTHADRHHAQHEAGNRGRALRHRLDTYRCFMKWVMTSYTTCKIQDIAIQKLLLKASGLEDPQRRLEKSVAIGTLVACAVRAAQKYGGRAGYVAAPSGHEWAPSDTHHSCGRRTNSKHASLTICEHCKVSIDRDLNAALNTLMVPEAWIATGRAA